jgi:meso-butanediol dehydrogenase/(S,S)-butanediol dehydrogenase/diacetyl reductase
MSYSPVAIVTGAARGIGLATTKRFLDAGWHVAMVDRDEPELRVAAAPLAERHGAALRRVGARPGRRDGRRHAGPWGQVDALINNAGVADFGPIEETDFARWRTVMETNLDGVFLCSQACMPALKGHAGPS